MRKLYRSRRDSKLFGLCGGLADYFNIDPTLLRLVTAITAFFSGGAVIPLYILASLVIPKEPVFDPPYGSVGPFTPPYSSGGCGYGHGPSRRQSPTPPSPGYAEPAKDPLDEMMKDVEKKAMHKEIEELRAKLAQYEKNKGDE